ncbi:MAG: YfcE family phosphodiesterase [Oscillospiraceae bacterium]|nr:YfcE family phosphodiesterase [Oscillospiraceae bacterium]
MRILVLSDSHSSLSFMRRCIEGLKPNAVIHLGDHFDDGAAMKEEFPGIPFYQVPGNCDRYRCPPGQPEILIYRIGGVDFYMTHGHRHRVKTYLSALLRDARTAGAAAALYGHTHVPDCHQEEDGLWVLNPGSCGYFGGSVGLIEISDGKIRSCRILSDSDLLD